MNGYWLATAGVTTILTFIGSAALTQDGRQARDDQNRGANYKFDDHARQTTTDWYNQHKDHPPAGLRNQDRLC